MITKQTALARRRFLEIVLSSAGVLAASSVLAACGGAAATAASSSAAASASAAAKSPAGSSAASPAGAQWQQTWTQWQAAAKQEGTVVVLGPPTPKLRQTLPPAVKAKLGLTVEYNGQGGSQFVAKLATERAAGTYSTDVVVAGAGSMFTGVAASGKVQNGVMGMLAPLKSQLLLPEVLDTSKYRDNKLWFVDPQGQ